MGHGNGGLDAMHRAQQRMKARKLKQKQKEQALLEAQRRATMQAIFEETAAKNSGYQDKSTVNTDEFISSEQGKNNEGNPTEVRPEDGVVYFYCPDIKKVKPKGFWGQVKKFFGAEEKKVQYIINYNPPTIQYPEESKLILRTHLYLRIRKKSLIKSNGVKKRCLILKSNRRIYQNHWI